MRLSVFFIFLASLICIISCGGPEPQANVEKQNTVKIKKTIEQSTVTKLPKEEPVKMLPKEEPVKVVSDGLHTAMRTTQAVKSTTVQATKKAAVAEVKAKKIPDTTAQKAASFKCAGSSGCILVFKVNDRMEPKGHDAILQAIKNKWFKTKQYQLVKPEDYQIDSYVGRVVITAEARKDYGEYELTIRTGKIKVEDGVAFEDPAAEDQGPDIRIDHRQSLKDLLREIKYQKP